MEILLTGGTGQLGSAIARVLVEAGHSVRALVRDRGWLGPLAGLDLPLVQGDVTQPGSLTAAVRGVEAVVHTAGAISYAAAELPLLRAVNVEGTRAVLDAAAAAGVRRVVLTSSIATVGEAPPDALGDEDTPWTWEGLGLGYFETKREAERLTLSDPRLEGVAVNPGITFGVGDLHLGAGRMILQVAAGGPPVVPCGATTVADLRAVAEAHLAALDRGQPGRRYILGGCTPTFLELYAEIAAVLGRPAPTRVVQERTLVVFGWLEEHLAPLLGRAPRITPPLARMSSRNRRYRSDRAVRELGYTPRPLRESVELTAGWLREQGLLPGG